MLIFGYTPKDLKEMALQSNVIKAICFVFNLIINLIKWIYGKIKNLWSKYIQRVDKA